MSSASYGWAQPTVRTLCELDPCNIRFCLEPDRATRHYIALCIRGLTRSSLDLGGPKWLASHIARDSRRSLLREIWGFDMGSPKLLARCLGGVWQAKLYDHLATVLGDKDRRAAVARLPGLRSKQVTALAEAPLELLRHSSIDVVLQHGIPVAAYVASGIRRREPSMSERDVFVLMSRTRRSKGLTAAIHEALLDAPLPEPPWPGTSDVRPLRTLRELREAAQGFQNCLEDPTRALRALTGDLAIYVAESVAGPVCASLKHDRTLQSWRLNEMKGVRNARPSPAASKKIREAFAAAGFPYLPEVPLGFWFDH